MNIRDLHYLVALAEHGHFGKAAAACFVSQPALSMQIKKLEEVLGIKLLERTNKSVLLTDSGFAIAERARNILQQVNELKEVAKLAQDPYAGELKLGIFPTLAPYLLPHIVPQLTKLYPKISFYLLEEQTNSLIEKLRKGDIHAAFLAMPIEDSHFITKHLFDEEFFLAAPKSHLLAKKKIINQSDLKGQQLLLLDEGHCLRAQALALCHSISALETKGFRATSLETLRHMVSAGVGITLIPHLACQPSNDLSYIPFSNPKPVRSIGLVWRQASSKQTLLTELAAKIKKMLPTTVTTKSLLKL